MYASFIAAIAIASTSTHRPRTKLRAVNGTFEDGDLMSEHFEVKFIPSGRGKARCAPDPAYPKGIKIDCAPAGVATCRVTLPYPAPECGWFEVDCRLCGYQLLVTAAGRPDDPTAITVPCVAG